MLFSPVPPPLIQPVITATPDLLLCNAPVHAGVFAVSVHLYDGQWCETELAQLSVSGEPDGIRFTDQVLVQADLTAANVVGGATVGLAFTVNVIDDHELVVNEGTYTVWLTAVVINEDGSENTDQVVLLKYVCVWWKRARVDAHLLLFSQRRRGRRRRCGRERCGQLQL